LLSGVDAKHEPNYRKDIQKAIQEYFEGKYIDFVWVPVCLGGLTDFQKRVLWVLKSIAYGKTITYSSLAAQSGFAKASRAVGRVLAANPLPLIIPCHRVVCSDGKLGGFSAEGGVEMKRRLLRLENPFCPAY